MMNLERIAAVTRRHLYEIWHNLDRITDTLFWPLLDVLTWGVFSVYLARHVDPSAVRLDQLLGGVIFWGVFRGCQRDIAVGFLAEIWTRNVVGLLVSPLTIAEYLTALILVDLAKILASFSAALLLGQIVYGSRLLMLVPQLLPTLFVLIIFGAATGIFVAGLILRFTSRVQTLAYGIAGVLMPLSCVFYPLSILPKPLQFAAWFLPTTHGFEEMRQVLDGHGHSASHLMWGLALSFVAFSLAAVSFSNATSVAHRKGNLVRLS